MLRKINLTEKFSLINETWSPKIAGQVNDCHVKLAKIKGEFVWHSHESQDEMFLVVSGEMELQTRDRSLILTSGEFVIVPKGVEHRPVALEETCIMLFEPLETVNTGDVEDSHTQKDLEWI
ncbi:cupin domain-containing protein [Dethiosulfatarculus sandiegensis]|uniref:Mannose-6-phosphate isomerase n=1 Tax=Dethiosulfatarculus sandiegensis TaxID=1429043 RepID=A0A0D2JCZ5_9BACT|nr:cupin domain-containing protein [Dethiosulfatarculus sandiegensis]KIX13626.1 mannose-6-phosphate isomerase [Dethiosulfatarculus sandiegensis]